MVDDAKVRKIFETTKEYASLIVICAFRLLCKIPPIEDEDALRRGSRIWVLGYQVRPSREKEASF